MNSFVAGLKHFYSLSERRQTYIVFAAVALAVILFNLIAIFGLDSLLHDDPRHYKDVIEGNFFWVWVKHFVLWPFMEWAGWNVMVYSAPLARGLYVLLYMVPISCCFYYVFRSKLGFSRLLAFSAAVIPNILPHQWQIPAGINISRTLYGFLFSVIALVVGLHYLEKSTSKNWLRLAGSSLSYIVSSQMMEQALFLFPPLALAFLGFTGTKKKKTRILSAFFVIAAARYIQMIVFTRKARGFVPPGEMLKRIGLYFKWSLPSPDIEPLYLAVFYVGIILLGFFLFVKYPRVGPAYKKYFSHMSERTYAVYLYVFLICWSVSTTIVFITMTSTFPPRYILMSAFGVNALFVFSLYVILGMPRFAGKYKPHLFILAGLLLYSGIYRYVNLERIYTPRNIAHSIVVRELGKIPFPPNSQVVVCGVPRLAVGERRSTGYLMRALNRTDIKGMLRTTDPRHPFHFYDHFSPVKATTGRPTQFSGLSKAKPVFFFSLLPEQDKARQFEYVLHWKGMTTNASWAILHAGKKTGKLAAYRAGVGMGEYLDTLDTLKKELETQGVSQSDILWGGPPSEVDQKRLERAELDPGLFRSGFFYHPFRFKKVGPGYVEEFLSVPGGVRFTEENIHFGDGLRLVSVLSDDISDSTGKATGFVYVLWESLKRHTYKREWLEITLFKEGVLTHRSRHLFSREGFKQETGDYISGGTRIPGAQLKNADYLGIRVTDRSTDAQKAGFSVVRGARKINGDGTRVLVPIHR